MSDWIQILPGGIAKKISDIHSLSSGWDSVNCPAESSISSCVGQAAEQMKISAKKAKETQTAMSQLLTNTAAWCQAVKISFEKTDNA